jgi:hypothetical protein
MYRFLNTAEEEYFHRMEKRRILTVVRGKKKMRSRIGP